MNDENQQAPKKIIIDEDWKSQIAAEREAEEKEAKAKDTAPAESVSQGLGEMPPASLEMLLTSLATEAMMSLGQMPIPGIDQPEVNLPQAQYIIDMIGVLKAKTEGNQSAEETALLEDLLHQLRLMYVAVEGGGGS